MRRMNRCSRLSACCCCCCCPVETLFSFRLSVTAARCFTEEERELLLSFTCNEYDNKEIRAGERGFKRITAEDELASNAPRVQVLGRKIRHLGVLSCWRLMRRSICRECDLHVEIKTHPPPGGD